MEWLFFLSFFLSSLWDRQSRNLYNSLVRARDFDEEWKMNQRIVSFLKPAMRYAGMIKDNETFFLTLRELNIKKNVGFTGG